MDELRRHLVDTRLAGQVATSPAESRRNCARLVAGLPDYTFGLPDWRDADVAEAEAAVVALCGPGSIGDETGPGHIDPEATLTGVAHHGRRLAAHGQRRSRVLVATGHPTGLLGHYLGIVAALSASGCEILTPRDDQWIVLGDESRSGIRYLHGVACVTNGGDLLHSHRSVYMEALLEACGDTTGLPELVVGDHGMAGAAIAHGIETLSIADVNDPALPLAAARGRTDGVLVIDDNLAPSCFAPVTAAMLARVTGG